MATPVQYAYSVAGDTLNGVVAMDALEQEIQVSSVVAAIDYAHFRVDGDVLTIGLKDTIAGDQAALNSVVNSHTGVALAEPPEGIEIVADLDERNPDGSLQTANRSLVLGNTHFARTDNGSQQMALDGTSAGTDVSVWDGTGAGDTGADWTVTGVGAETAGSMHSGTNGWHTTAQSGGTSTKFDNGSTLDVVGTYNSISFWLQPKIYPGNATLRVGWLDGASAQNGVSLNVENYVTNMDLDVWQRVEIPIADFNLTADVQSFEFRYMGAGSQRHFIDEVELHNSGGAGPYIFQVIAPANEGWHATMLVLVLAGSDTGWNSDAFANIAGGLMNGLLIRQRKLSTGDVMWSMNTKDNVDLFGRFHPQESFLFDNSELLVGFMVKPGQSADIVVTDDDVLEFVVRDNLSALNNIRAFLHYGVEDVT